MHTVVYLYCRSSRCHASTVRRSVSLERERVDHVGAEVDAKSEHLLGLGIIPFDLSVRESVYGHTRPTATGNTRRKHTKIRSYVIDTSLAWDDRTLRANATREWRVPSKRAGANQSPDSAKSRAEAKLHGAAAG